jgi:hypothetical protein
MIKATTSPDIMLTEHWRITASLSEVWIMEFSFGIL